MAAAEAYYRCEVKPFSRAQGHSATAAAAYRAKDKIHDQRTGLTHDYRRRSGVEHTELVIPEAATWVTDRETLWNAAELGERRSNARVAREVIVCFPHQLEQAERMRTARDFGQWLVKEYGVGVDIALHRPGRKGDERNYHAHVLFTTRHLTAEGMGAKTRVLDDKTTGSEEIAKIRQVWAAMVNRSLERSQLDARVDHRSYKDRGIDKIPQLHLGRAVIEMEQRGMETERGQQNREIQVANDNIGHLDREIARLKRQRDEELQRQQQQQVGQAVALLSVTERDAPMQKRKTQQREDPTLRAVSRQLKGLNAEAYEIGIYDRQQGRMQERTWTHEDLLQPDESTGKYKNLDWLRARNAQGCDIYIRPAPIRGHSDQEPANAGLILVDDVGIGTLQRLEADGYKPAVIVQTSPGNYQAWIRVSDQAIAKDQATATAKILAERYDTDPNSADWRHYGRLAGFTNQKGLHTQYDGKQPYVLLQSYYGKKAKNAPKLIAEAEQRVQAATLAAKKINALENAPVNTEGPSNTDPAAAAIAFRKIRDRRLAKYGTPQDHSRNDFMICKLMVRQGFSTEGIQSALVQESQNIDERKKGHLEDYAERTERAARRKVQEEQAQYLRYRSELEQER